MRSEEKEKRREKGEERRNGAGGDTWASSGLAIGPPWHKIIISRLTSSAASAHSSIIFGVSSSFRAVTAPIPPPTKILKFEAREAQKNYPWLILNDKR